VSLFESELLLLADEIDREFKNAVVQKVYAPSTSVMLMELRIPGRSVLVKLSAETNAARISAVEERPPNPPIAHAWQHVFRNTLVGAKLHDAEVIPKTGTLLLHFTKLKPFTLVLETRVPGIFFLNETTRILALSKPAREGMRLGGTWSLEAEAEVPIKPSRLQSDFVNARLLHGAELLFHELEEKKALKESISPVLAAIKRLEKTKVKVRADIARTFEADRFRVEGELLRTQMHLVKRGSTSIQLHSWNQEGEEIQVEIKLDPKRSPKEEVEYRFHQYKRMTRGRAVAENRLKELDAEEKKLQEQLLNPPHVEIKDIQKSKEQKSIAYKVYESSGQTIWVGKGSTKNDELTFQIAKPFHLWLHARGVPGAHVVIPLNKNAELKQEVLLDACHLALFHSDSKGEPKGEVSYVPVKYVKKAGAPGAVHFTQEKTVMIRVEQTRLKRLLATEGRP
jgi:predicted ribosome quality control (RQC) complex YloA/Tae2 family protein